MSAGNRLQFYLFSHPFLKFLYKKPFLEVGRIPTPDITVEVKVMHVDNEIWQEVVDSSIHFELKMKHLLRLQQQRHLGFRQRQITEYV